MNKEIVEALDHIKDDLREIKGDINEMKVDVSHHIKRSDKHETYIMKIVVILALASGAGLLQLGPYIGKLIP